MSCLFKAGHADNLTEIDRDQVIEKIRTALENRVLAAYVFGSFASKTYTAGSDIDLILIIDTDVPFTKRGMEFGDLHDIYPALDLLIYTPNEFASQMKETLGFWGSVKKSLVQILP